MYFSAYPRRPTLHAAIKMLLKMQLYKILTLIQYDQCMRAAASLVVTMTSLCYSGFQGEPVMLRDGSIVDSSMLPQNSVQEHPVTVSAESLIRTVTASGGAHAHPISFSGGSIMDTEEQATPGIYESASGPTFGQRQSEAYEDAPEALIYQTAHEDARAEALRSQDYQDPGAAVSLFGRQGANDDQGQPAMRSEPTSPRAAALQRRRIDLRQTNPSVNVVAAQSNLNRHLELAGQGIPLRYHPIALSGQASSSLPSDTSVPGLHHPPNLSFACQACMCGSGTYLQEPC